ncbi:MAG: hypothetical protein ACLGIS_16460, partial [Actinomycetes bacterium]
APVPRWWGPGLLKRWLSWRDRNCCPLCAGVGSGRGRLGSGGLERWPGGGVVDSDGGRASPEERRQDDEPGQKAGMTGISHD